MANKYILGMIKIGGVGLVFFLVCATLTWAQTENAGLKDNLGLGVDLGFQKLYGDDAHTGFAPASEAYFKILVSRRFHLSLGLGYGELSDGSLFDEHHYITNMFIGDLRSSWVLSQRRFRPYLTLGIGAHNWQFKGDRWDPVAKKRLRQQEKTERIFSAHSISGGGFEVFMSPRVAFNALADYRFVLSKPADNLDGRIGGDSRDGYLNLRAGLTFYFENQLQDQAENPQLIANLINEEEGETSPFSESELEDSDRQDSLMGKIDRLDASENEITMEQYLHLKEKVAELKKKIETGDQEINQMVSFLGESESRMRDLETEYQQLLSRSGSQRPARSEQSSGSTTGTISVDYETALREYYSNNFETAINLFTNLINQWPQHRLVSNCQYWIGEGYYGLGNYAEAASAFKKVFDYPDNPKDDDAAIMLGKCYLKLGDYAAAREYLQKLMKDYPKSEYSSRAQSLLTGIQ